MHGSDADKVFAGAIPHLYDSVLVPLIFEPDARDIATRLAARNPSRVLEIAAGTGAVTRVMASLLPQHVAIVATDLNPAMLEQAASVGTCRPVTWRQADAMALPFADAAFDAVVCQFGAMFFPDRVKAYAEVRRVLAPGGVFIFNVWDHIGVNEFADTVTGALASFFSDDPPRFLARTPHGYCDAALIESDLAHGGFTRAACIETVTACSRASAARIPAMAYCQGTPLRNEIEARDATRLVAATDMAAEAIAGRFGRGEVAGKIQALVVTVEA
jgi:SAM-dependent methyltransferase